jgi:hypothetical protein
MDYYKILELEKIATIDDIKKSYRRLALKYHPDKNNSPNANEMFQQISQAYQILSDENKRRDYDTSGNSSIEFESAEELFKNYFNKFDSELGAFLTNTLNMVSSSINNSNNKNIWDVWYNLDTDMIIDGGSKIVKNILHKKQAKNKDIPINNVKYVKDVVLNINQIVESSIGSNEIKLDIEALQKYLYIKLIINNDSDNDKSKCFTLDMSDDIHTIQINGLEYDFILNVIYPPNISRLNLNDLVLKYNLDSSHLFDAFHFKYPITKKLNIECNIELRGEGNIVMLENRGTIHKNSPLPGNIYIIFLFVKGGLYECESNNTLITYNAYQPINLIQ